MFIIGVGARFDRLNIFRFILSIVSVRNRYYNIYIIDSISTELSFVILFLLLSRHSETIPLRKAEGISKYLFIFRDEKTKRERLML
jgi:hypothetical protein